MGSPRVLFSSVHTALLGEQTAGGRDKGSRKMRERKSISLESEGKEQRNACCGQRHWGWGSLYEHTGLHRGACPQLKCPRSGMSPGAEVWLEHTAVCLLWGAAGRLKLHPQVCLQGSLSPVRNNTKSGDMFKITSPHTWMYLGGRNTHEDPRPLLLHLRLPCFGTGVGACLTNVMC